jgi:hypothetical protein
VVNANQSGVLPDVCLPLLEQHGVLGNLSVILIFATLPRLVIESAMVNQRES